MVTSRLLSALSAFVKHELQYYTATDEGHNKREITVCPGFLKRREEADEEFFPYVVIRALNGEDTQEESTVRIRFIIGVRDEDPKTGWLTTLNIVEHIRQALLKQVVINHKYMINRPLKWSLDEAEAYPLWFGYIDAEVTVANPQQEINWL